MFIYGVFVVINLKNIDSEVYIYFEVIEGFIEISDILLNGSFWVYGIFYFVDLLF